MGSALPQSLGVFIEAPGVKTYTLDLDSGGPYTISKLSLKTDVGSATVSLEQNGSAIPGALGIAVGTTLTTVALDAPVATDDTIALAVSATAGAGDLSASIQTQYATPFLPLAGGMLAGNLTLASNSPILFLQAAAGASSIYGLSTGLRWIIQMPTADAESGGNAGSNFALFCYDDTGAYMGNPFYINRQSGNVTIPGGLTVGQSMQVGGVLTVSNTIQGDYINGAQFVTTGGNAAYLFADRTSARQWTWYGSGDTVYLYNGSANVFSIDPSGDVTISGTLTLSADPTTALEAATKQYVDNIWVQITQADYDALSPPDPDTLYVIVN